MDSDLAIFISQCLKEVDRVKIHWRVIKAYSDDWDEFKKSSRQYGLRYVIINHLSKKKSWVTQYQIVKELDILSGTLSKIVQRLIKKGIIEQQKQIYTNHRLPTKPIRLTKLGRRIARRRIALGSSN